MAASTLGLTSADLGEVGGRPLSATALWPLFQGQIEDSRRAKKIHTSQFSSLSDQLNYWLRPQQFQGDPSCRVELSVQHRPCASTREAGGEAGQGQEDSELTGEPRLAEGSGGDSSPHKWPPAEDPDLDSVSGEIKSHIKLSGTKLPYKYSTNE